LAEFRDHYDEIRRIPADVAALTIDDAGQAETVRSLYQLQFPILCDPRAEVIKGWGLYNAGTKGGVSHSAVYVIEPGLKVRFFSKDSTVSRVRADGVLDYLRASAAGQAGPSAPPRRLVVPTVGEIARTTWPGLKLTLFPPKRD